MTRLHRAALLAGALLLAACGSAGAPPAAGAPERARNLITAEEVAASHEPNAYMLVSRLHPQWLRRRGARTVEPGGDIQVYLDRTRMGGPDALRQIPLSSVREVRFLTAPEAASQFGNGNEYGAIVVVSR